MLIQVRISQVDSLNKFFIPSLVVQAQKKMPRLWVKIQVFAFLYFFGYTPAVR